VGRENAIDRAGSGGMKLPWRSGVIPRNLRGQIDAALSREGLSFDDDAAAVNALVNAYHGYKNSYEKLQQGSPLPAPAAVDTAAPTPGAEAPGEPYYRPIFDFDGLRNDPQVIHNHDFMRDRAYIAAYGAGVDALKLDHKMYWRLHVVLYLASRGLKLEGDFVECGVWRGFLAAAIARYTNWDTVPKTFYLFDTFEGLAEDRLTAEERANTEKITHLNKHFADSFGAAQANFAAYPNIKLVKGFVPDTLTTVEIEKVAYLSLDMNNVSPEIAAAEYFWDRMVPSAPIILDDYGFVSYEAQKRAFDDFARRKGVEVLHLPTGQGLILKP
jgi:hypothetical protein